MTHFYKEIIQDPNEKLSFEFKSMYLFITKTINLSLLELSEGSKFIISPDAEGFIDELIIKDSIFVNLSNKMKIISVKKNKKSIFCNFSHNNLKRSSQDENLGKRLIIGENQIYIIDSYVKLEYLAIRENGLVISLNDFKSTVNVYCHDNDHNLINFGKIKLGLVIGLI